MPALAVTPDEMLQDPVLEARARALSAELRELSEKPKDQLVADRYEKFRRIGQFMEGGVA